MPTRAAQLFLDEISLDELNEEMDELNLEADEELLQQALSKVRWPERRVRNPSHSAPCAWRLHGAHHYALPRYRWRVCAS